LAVAAPLAQRTASHPDSAGLGDPSFPLAGNSGYDVSHYSSLRLRYDSATRHLDGTATIRATATRPVTVRSRSMWLQIS
jgi:hypothetical protein